MVRGRRGPTPADILDREDDSTDEEDAAETDTGSSIEDLTREANPEAFDQTFSDDDVNLTIEGAFDAAAGSKQVIPRIAYVMNYNMVWNPDRGRWEPKKKGTGSAAPPPITRVGLSSTQTVGGGAFDAIQYDTVHVDPDGNFDTATNAYVAPAAGQYEIQAKAFVAGTDGNTEYSVTLFESGGGQNNADAGVTSDSSGGQLSISVNGVFELEAGDTFRAYYNNGGGSSVTISSAASATYFHAIPLGAR